MAMVEMVTPARLRCLRLVASMPAAMMTSTFVRGYGLVIGVVTGAACHLLIPPYGLLGAAWAVVLATAVQLLGSAAVIVYALRGPAAGGRR